MFVEQIYTGCLSQASYFIESGGESAIIDPIREVDVYIEKAKTRNSKIKYIFQTHCEPTPRERSNFFVVCRHSSPGLLGIFLYGFTAAGRVHVCLCVQAVPTFLPRVVPDDFVWFHILLVVCNVCITSWRRQVGHGNQSTYGSVVISVEWSSP